MDKIFFHVDLDAFFANIEIRDNPEYKDKPLVIGYLGPRSVCSTCSYEARKYGIHSGMPTLEAYKLCPSAIFVHGNMEKYSQVSKQIMTILASFTPTIIQASIDEAYLDMSGMSLLYNNIEDAAYEIKRQIWEKTKLTLSIGISGSKYISKLASDYNKPNGLTVVNPGDEIDFIDRIGIKKLWGIGPSTYNYILKKGFRTTSGLRSLNETEITTLFGQSMGEFIYKVVRGIDPGIYEGEVKNKSISAERTFFPDLRTREQVDYFLLELSQEVSFKVLEAGLSAKTLSLKVRYGDFKTISISSTSNQLYNSTNVANLAKELFYSKKHNAGIRLLGISLKNLSNNQTESTLFSQDDEKQRNLESIILGINKHGALINRASLIEKNVKNKKNS